MAFAEHDGENDSNGEAEMALGLKTLQEFLNALGLPAGVTGRIEETQILLSVDSAEGGTLIGRKGQTLNALQHLINSVVRSAKFRVFVDIGDYRQRSIERLEDIAHRVAEQAKQGGRRVELKPMTAAERRIIHLTIQTYPELSTESIGEDPYRRIVVIPAGAPPLPPSRTDFRPAAQAPQQPDHRGTMHGAPSRDPRRGGQRIPRQDGDNRPPRYPDAAPAARYDGPRPAPQAPQAPRGPMAPGPVGPGPVRQQGPRPGPAAGGGGGGGGVDRWGYTRDIPAEARAWMDDNQQVKPISGNPSWEAVEEPSTQPWVKDQPVFRPAASPWVDSDEVEYTEPGPADRW